MKKFVFGMLCLAVISGNAFAHQHRPINSTPTNTGSPESDVTVPVCLDKNGQSMQPNNDQVIDWKTHTANQYHDRAFVVGTVAGLTLDRATHLQLDVDLSPASTNGDSSNKADHIEVIFNKGFGADPVYHVGDQIEACGDYITANAPANGYPASPLGAIIHWVHASDTPRHPSGFMEINGVLYGQGHSSNGDYQQNAFFQDFSDLSAAAGF